MPPQISYNYCHLTKLNIQQLFVLAPDSFVRNVVHIVCNAHARVMEAENSITLTIYSSEHIFIALRWHSEMIMGFHEYTYRTVNT